MRKLLITSLLLCIITLGYAQQDSIRKFGIGLHVEQFKLIDLGLNSSIIPSNKIIFTYNYKSTYRIEPVFGLIRYKRDDYQSTGYHLGLGNYFLLKKERTLIHLGFKVGYDNVYEERDRYDYGSEKLQERETRLSIGPSIGGEYLFGNHFSIAGEIGLFYFKSTQKDNQDTYDSEDSKSSYLLTDTGLILRFYF